MNFSNVTIIIPTLHEENSIGQLLTKLLVSCPDVSILIMDDCSGDRTGEIVRSFNSSKILFIERRDSLEQGITASVLDGIKKCTTKHFVVMDADGQHPIEMILQVLQALLSYPDSLIIASRKGAVANSNRMRHSLSVLAILIARTTLQIKYKVAIQDPMSGCFAGPSAVVKELLYKVPHSFFEYKNFKVLFEILRAGGASLTTIEIPYILQPRMRGVSKLKPWHFWYALKSCIRLFFR